MVVKCCKICGTEFEAFRSAVTCSKICSDKNNRKLNTAWCATKRKNKIQKCDLCNNTFKYPHIRKFCSKKCHSEFKAEQARNLVWTDEMREKRRIQQVNMLSSGRMSKKSSIEIIMEDTLKNNNIEYQSQFKYKYGIADFFIPEFNTIIECDGDYWHSRPEVEKRDKRQTEYLKTKGYTVLRFSEQDINNDCSKLIRSTGW